MFSAVKMLWYTGSEIGMIRMLVCLAALHNGLGTIGQHSVLCYDSNH